MAETTDAAVEKARCHALGRTCNDRDAFAGEPTTDREPSKIRKLRLFGPHQIDERGQTKVSTITAMRSVPNDDLVFTEGEIPARCEHCKRDGEITLRVMCGKIVDGDVSARAADARMFRPERLIVNVPQEREFDALVSRIDIGSEPCMSYSGALSAAIFAEATNDVGITYPTLATGIEATIVLRNQSAKPIKVMAKFRGTSVYPDVS